MADKINFPAIPQSEWTEEVKGAVELLNKENGSETDTEVYAFGKCKEYHSLFSLVLMVIFVIIIAALFGIFVFILNPDLSTKVKLEITALGTLVGIIVSLIMTVLKAVVTSIYVITDSYFIMYRGLHSKDNRWIKFTAESAALKVGNRKALYVAAVKNGSAPARRKPKGNYIGEVSVISIAGISADEESRIISVIEELSKRREG